MARKSWVRPSIPCVPCSSVAASCPYRSDAEKFTAISSYHFLNGNLAANLPEPNFPQPRTTLSSRLQELLQLKQSFWRRWSKDYLNQLQSRPKWHKQSQNLREDELVLIKDERIPPLNWLMGCIVQVNAGKNNLLII